MLRDGRLIVLDRYLPREELFVATCAMDVISVAYYTDQLSANLLAAVAAYGIAAMLPKSYTAESAIAVAAATVETSLRYTKLRGLELLGPKFSTTGVTV